MANDIKEVKECPECGSDNVLLNKRQRLVCKECGMIHEPMTPQSEEQFKKAAKFKRE